MFDFGTLPASRLVVKVAISGVSEANAVANLEAEVPGWDFDATRAAAAKAWRDALAAVEIDAPEPVRKLLYSSLYHSLLTLIRPDSDNVDFVRSLVASYQASPDGVLPVWQFQGLETWTMIASASNPRYAGLDEYMKLGWVAADKEREGASKTLEFAFDDWTIARTAAGASQRFCWCRTAQRQTAGAHVHPA